MHGSVSDFTVLTECLYDEKNQCRPKHADDMKCHVDTTSGQANLTDVSTIEGKWWVTKGVNPHYDNLPCQHNRYQFDKEAQQWINNVTWVDADDRTPKLIGIKPSVTAPYPGYFVHWYPTLNQTEPWVVVSKPHEDYMMMLWCGENPVMKYAGGILLSKSKNYDDMPKWVEDEIREKVVSHGLDWDKLFINDNSQCEDDHDYPVQNALIQ